MNAWLSPSVFEWFPLNGGGSVVDPAMRQRAYEYLQRSEYLLTYNPIASEHDRADCISNLRRCLSHRLKQIEAVYNLRTILQTPKKRHYLEILADLNVIRPSLIKGLLVIRNDVEYNDATPPDTLKCQELVDVMWYFLRSTDPLLYTTRTDIELSSPEPDPWNSDYGCDLRIQYGPTFEVGLSGWFPIDLTSAVEKPTYLVVNAEQFHTKAGSSFAQYHPDREDDDIWVLGKMLLQPHERQQLVKLAMTMI